MCIYLSAWRFWPDGKVREVERKHFFFEKKEAKNFLNAVASGSGGIA